MWHQRWNYTPIFIRLIHASWNKSYLMSFDPDEEPMEDDKRWTHQHSGSAHVRKRNSDPDLTFDLSQPIQQRPTLQRPLPRVSQLFLLVCVLSLPVESCHLVKIHTHTHSHTLSVACSSRSEGVTEAWRTFWTKQFEFTDGRITLFPCVDWKRTGRSSG